VGAIFSGSDKGNLSYIKNKVRDFNLNDRVKFVGFIENELLPYFYKQSIALVMPTYFGPTNLPPLEAFILEVPVMYSDIKGLKNQVGDAALLLDLNNPETMSINIKNLLENSEIAFNLIKKGKNIINKELDINHSLILTELLHSFQRKRICWD
jgi:glycosyltransferase involved in cell wall biosynthesis